MPKPSILDRLVLFRHKILKVENLSRQLRVVRTDGNDVALVLRFTHPGSSMYYKLDRSEAQALKAELQDLLDSN